MDKRDTYRYKDFIGRKKGRNYMDYSDFNNYNNSFHSNYLIQNKITHYLF